MKQGVRRFAFWALAVVVALVVPSWTVRAASPLRLGVGSDVGTLNPYNYNSGNPGYDLMLLVYDTLYHRNADNLPQPWLVADARVEGGQVWTLKLHQGMTWHDGQPLTSADVAFTFDYVRTKEGTHSRYTPAARTIERIETPDPQTVIFTLAQPLPRFATYVLAEVPILPRHIWADQAEPRQFSNSVGSGPYRVVEAKPGEFVRLEAHGQYFRGAPAVDAITVSTIKDRTTLFTALKADQLDAVAYPVPAEYMADLQAQPGLKIMTGPSFSTTLLALNVERPPFNQVDFRRALDLAIDKQSLVRTLLLGQGTVASPGFVHPQSAWANSGLSARFDSDQSRRLLDGLGYRDRTGDGVRERPDGSPLQLEILAYSSNPLRVRTAELIAAQLKTVGLQVNVQAQDMATVDDRVWPGFDVRKGRNYDMAVWGWSSAIQVDPSRITGLVHSQPNKGVTNIGGYKHPELDQLADQMDTAFAPEDQRQLVHRLQELIAAEVPFIPLYHPTEANVFNAGAYDQYVYAKGTGIWTKLSLLPAARASLAAGSGAMAGASPAVDRAAADRAPAPQAAAAPAATAPAATAPATAAPAVAATGGATAAAGMPAAVPGASGRWLWVALGAAVIVGGLLVLRRRMAR